MNNKNYNKIEWEKILSFKNKYIYEKYDIDDIQNIYPNQTKKCYNIISVKPLKKFKIFQNFSCE